MDCRAMDRNAVLALFDQQIRQGLSSGPATAQTDLARRVLADVGSDGSWVTIVWSDLDASTVDLAIAEQIARFAPLGRDFEW